VAGMVHFETVGRASAEIDLQVLSLFTGAGGLDLGLECAGFSTIGCVEKDRDCRATLAANRPDWALIEPGDILELAPKRLLAQVGAKPGELALVAGGPPCQPFSKSSFWRTGEAPGMNDPRARTLRAYLNVIEHAQPQAMLLENVKGIGYVGRGKDGEEQALEFLAERLNEINLRCGTQYQPYFLHLDAANYGVPQHRERVFVFAHRDGKELKRPDSTHGPKAEGVQTKRVAWAWDALAELDVDCDADELRLRGEWAELLPSIPEGFNYQHHTPRGDGEPLFGWRTKYWSFLLKLARHRPSWTIQAQPGPATGPFHWDNRRLAVAEMAALQTFPAGYEIKGSYGSARKQLGNAVPSAVGELLGLAMREHIYGCPLEKQLELIPVMRNDCPDPAAAAPVPERYLSLRSDHAPHPGTGKGPAARIWKAEREAAEQQAA
jgi:DNA (cytosine-5)-methyltransferase 1